MLVSSCFLLECMTQILLRLAFETFAAREQQQRVLSYATKSRDDDVSQERLPLLASESHQKTILQWEEAFGRQASIFDATGLGHFICSKGILQFKSSFWQKRTLVEKLDAAQQHPRHQVLAETFNAIAFYETLPEVCSKNRFVVTMTAFNAPT